MKKTSRILITLSPEQTDALASLMSQDLASNKSAFIGMLIGAEAYRRASQSLKRPVGRPKKEERHDDMYREDGNDYEDTPDYSHDTPKNIPHFGRMIGPRELADLEDQSEGFKPQG